VSPVSPRKCGRDEPSPGADAAGASPVPVQMWPGRAQSRCRCGRGEPSPGADAAAASPVPVQMWPGRAQSQCRCGRGEPSSPVPLLGHAVVHYHSVEPKAHAPAHPFPRRSTRRCGAAPSAVLSQPRTGLFRCAIAGAGIRRCTSSPLRVWRSC
jgi:hypothetical protein